MGQLVFQATAGGQVALVGPNPSASFSLNVPAVSGTLVTTGDTGTVTNTMLASNAYTAPGTIGSGTANSGAFTSLSATSFTNTGTDTATKFIPTGSSVTGNGLYLPATNSLGLSTNGTNALYIDASQNVGIGTSSPATKLDVVGTIRASQSLAFGTNGTSGVGTIYSDSNWGCLITAKQASPALADFMWQNGSSVERMRIDTSGNLLVGCTANTNSGGFILYKDYDAVNSSSLDIGHITGSASGNRYIRFQYAGSTIGSITQTGTTAVLYNTTSDYRLKENVKPIQNALATIEALNPVSFTWVDGRPDDGFIAHEIQAIIPNCVTGEKDAVNEDGTPKYQQMDNSGVIPFLVKAIQELNAKVDAQAAEIIALQTKVGT